MNQYPEYGRAYQELGHIYKATQHNAAAIAAYQAAVGRNPALIASWAALTELARQQQDMATVQHAQQQYQRLSQLPKALLSVSSMIYEGHLYKAERLCRHFLQNNKHHIEGMRLLAQIGAKLYVLDDAEFLLESCITFDPNNQHARMDYVGVLQKRQKFAKALEQATILRQAEPGNLSFESAYASVCVSTGAFAEALSVYDRILAQQPQQAHIHLVRGHALKTIGQQDDAIDAYRNAYRNKVDFGDAYWSLANLKTYRFSDQELQAMEAQVKHERTGLVDRYHLNFALGKAYEDSGDYAVSFGHYETGNRLKQSELRYSADRFEADVDRQISTLTESFFAARKGFGHQAPDPIFIVGLPRAGSTLLEQILASHSQVEGTSELPNILALIHRLNGRRPQTEQPRYPDILTRLDAERLAEFGRRYIEDTQIHRSGSTYFIDKMPNNFRHIGLIHLILPNAKIIDARRHPMACCFSAYKQLFAEGQEFTYGQEEVGRYYKDYCRLMDHWDQVLPGRVLRVRYEAVVQDTATEVRRILEYLGLDYEENCLNFYNNKRSVRTASSEQVRKPVYQSGLDYWRHYEPYLNTMKQALGDALHHG
ncbi:MAG: sulfotransferase [Xanthomonadales bacterium]|nr:sulfotransferase [Xanthomonadales bacterium]